MSDLIDHILNEDYVEAKKIFESRMEDIKEKKLYEVKRSMDIAEVVSPVKGKPGQFKGQNTPKDWAKYRKQHPSLGMHEIKPGVKASVDKHEKSASGGLTKHGIEVRKKKGYIQAYPATKALEFIKAVTKYHKTGKIDENTPFMKRIQSAHKELEKTAPAPSSTSGKAPEIEPQTRGEPVKKLGPKNLKNPMPKTSYSAYSDYETKARELKGRGSQAASKWLKKTKTARNTIGAVKSFGKFVGRVARSFDEGTE